MRVAQPGRDERSDKWFRYPLLPFFTEMDRTHVLVRSMPGLVMPWATTLEVAPDLARSDRLNVSELVRTSKDTAVAGERLDIMPEQLLSAIGGMRAGESRPVALAVTGEFSSAFAEPPASGARAGRTHLASGPGRLLVIGSSMGLENLSPGRVFEGFSLARMTEGKTDPAADLARYTARFLNWQLRFTQLSAVIDSNMGFVYNCLDWGVQNDALADIRSKSVDGRPLAVMSPVASGAWQIGLIVGLPLLFALFGVIRYRVRRRRS